MHMPIVMRVFVGREMIGIKKFQAHVDHHIRLVHPMSFNGGEEIFWIGTVRPKTLTQPDLVKKIEKSC